MKEETSVLDLAADTLKDNKQAIIFFNTRRSAEKGAEEISKKLQFNAELQQLQQSILHDLGKATQQCERLANCIIKGIAFHHSGLTNKQKEAVEDAFRDGRIKIICATPTLAAGVDLPAYRVILNDVRRYGKYGLDWIPVLEYYQQAGRAGRPSYDDKGEAITVAKTIFKVKMGFNK